VGGAKPDGSRLESFYSPPPTTSGFLAKLRMKEAKLLSTTGRSESRFSLASSTPRKPRFVPLAGFQALPGPPLCEYATGKLRLPDGGTSSVGELFTLGDCVLWHDHQLARLMAPILTHCAEDLHGSHKPTRSEASHVFVAGVLCFNRLSQALPERLMARLSHAKCTRWQGQWARFTSAPSESMVRIVCRLALVAPEDVVSIFPGGFRRLRRRLGNQYSNLHFAACFPHRSRLGPISHAYGLSIQRMNILRAYPQFATPSETEELANPGSGGDHVSSDPEESSWREVRAATHELRAALHGHSGPLKMDSENCPIS